MGMGSREFRLAAAADLPALARIYRETVRTLGPGLYTPDQVAAWAAYAEETGSFREFVLKARTQVALVDGAHAGFCGVEPGGRVASLYVDAAHTRRGLGGALLERALDDARATWGLSRFHTEASHFSRALFARNGFAVDEEEVVVRNGVSFHRFKMVRVDTA